MNQVIDDDPEVLGAEIAALLANTIPAVADILELQRQLLARHTDLPDLEPMVSSEEVVESFFRCCIVHHLQQRCELHTDSIPDCINSSHRATRRVCAAPSEHCHVGISDDAWAIAWRRLQKHPGVNRSPKRADLYVVARDKIVSFEFKYIGVQGLRDAAGCATQVRGHASNHALAFLVPYCGTTIDVYDDAMVRLNRLVGDNARVVGVHGPPIPVVRATAA